MEGLLINAVLVGLPDLPCHTRGWVFPDEGSAVLRLSDADSLVMRYRPPHPMLSRIKKVPETGPKTPFQRMLAARVKGRLLRVQQLRLDRVAFFFFEGEQGFVDTPPVRLVFELTGRNANLILTEPNELILGLDREIGAEINRYRILKPRFSYRPPPPYVKLDPRSLQPTDLEILLGTPLVEGLIQHVDGIGKALATEIVRQTGLTPRTTVTDTQLPLLYQTLLGLVHAPTVVTPLNEALAADWQSEEAETLKKPFLAILQKRRKAILGRLADQEIRLTRLAEAVTMRKKGDLLMAYAHQVPKGAQNIRLEDFETGEPLEIRLEPSQSARQNAERYYTRARRSVRLAERARQQIPEAKAALHAVDEEIAEVREADPKTLQQALRSTRSQTRARLGLRHTAPGGFEVWVGRSNRENDLLTRAARSQDIWLHVQGIPGSHVILRSGHIAAPLEALLFAAQLAAYHSKARGERGVAVDYTHKKYVWKPHKAALGQVLYTQAKTLIVSGEAPKDTE